MFNRVNGRRPPATSPSLKGTQETYTLAHEENVRFVSEGSAEARECDLGHWSFSHCNLTRSCQRPGLFLGSLPVSPVTIQQAAHSQFWAGVQGSHHALGWETQCQGPGSA